MTNTELWQILCAALAIGFALAAIFRLVRTPRWHVAVLLVQLLLVPETALVAEVLNPGPLPDPNQLLVIVGIAGGAALVAMAVNLWRRRTLMADTIPIVTVQRHHRAAFAARTLTILMISGFLFTFAPWFAVANVLAYAVWIAIWIPRSWRKIDIAVAQEIAAPPHKVFEAAIDPTKWSGTSAGTVTVTPAGPLRAGSQIASRQSLHNLSSNPRIAKFLETTRVVTSVVTDGGYTMFVAGQPDSTGGLDLVATRGGTRATNWSKGTMSVAEAASGLFWELPAVLATRKAEMREALASLKQTAEGSAEGPVGR